MPAEQKNSNSRRSKKLESPEERTRWLLDDGLIYPKGLAKTLPGTAAALRDRSFSVEEFLLELRALEPKDFIRDQMLFFLAVQFTLVAVTDQCLVGPFIEDFLKLLHQKVDENESLQQYMGTSKVLPVQFVKDTFEEVCDLWKSRLEILNGEPLDKSCGAYKVSVLQFSQIYNCFLLNYAIKNDIKTKVILRPDSYVTIEFSNKDEEESFQKAAENKNIGLENGTLAKNVADQQEFEYIQKMYMDRRRMVAENAIKGVVAGDHLVKSTCWRCNKVGKNIQRCGGCSTARYCSEDCQTKDWKCSHKDVCSKLKWTHEQTLIHFEIVDAMIEKKSFSDRPVIKDLLPNHLIDYKFARVASITSRKFPFFRPSIQNYYKNLENLFYGGTHWVFKPDDSSLPNPHCCSSNMTVGGNLNNRNKSKKKKGKKQQKHTQLHSQEPVTKLLPQKPLQSWEAAYILDGMVPLGLVTDLSYMSQVDQNSIKKQLFQKYGPPKMTAKRFLYIYLTRYETPCPNRIKTFRLEALTSCLRDMRMKF